MVGRFRRLAPLVAALAAVALAGTVPLRPAAVAAEAAPAPLHIDDGGAPPAWLDPSFLPAALSGGEGGEGPTVGMQQASVESLRPDGSSGFLPFSTRAHDYGAYRFQLVASGADGDVEVLRPAVEAAAAALTQITGISFSVDPGSRPRPASVNRFAPGYCPSSTVHHCSFFDDQDLTVGAIRVGFSSGSPCGALIPSGTSNGAVGCGGPESVRTPDGAVFHVRGNVWLSPSLADVNASIAGVVVAHEVGHAIGLDHYSPAYTAVPGGQPVRQLMYPSVHDDPTDTGLAYRTGDAHGVWWLHHPDAWYITATYRDFLGRVPDTSGYHYWVSSGVGRDEYVSALAGSDEWVGRIVADFYADVFGRAPDPGGFAYWAGQVRGAGVPFVAGQLYGSDEYLRANGGTTTGFVQAMYRQLLGRDPAADPNGVAYWVAEADRRGRPAVAHAFFQSDEKRRGRVHELYCTLLDRPPDSGGSAYWSQAILLLGDLALARHLATSTEYVARADEFSLRPPSPTC